MAKVELRSDELFRPSDLADMQRILPEYFRRPLRLLLSEDWFTPEPTVCWMRGKVGRFRFRSDIPPQTEVTVYLRLVGSPLSANQTLRVVAGDTKVDQRESTTATKLDRVFPCNLDHQLSSSPLGPSDFTIRVNARTSDDGIVEIWFHVHGTTLPRPANDARDICVGMRALGYAARSDVDTRLDVIDALRKV